MKILGLFVLTAAVLALALPVLFLDADLGTSTVLAKDKKEKGKEDGKKEDGKKEGGSKFDDDDEKEDGKKEEEKIPDKPVKKTYVLADYRLQFDIEDSRFWKQDKNYNDKETEQGVCLKMVMKRPKSDDHFDVNLFCQGVEHKMTMSWPDGTKIGAANIKGLASKNFDDDIAEWKETKNITKPKSLKLSRDTGKVYHYSFTGMSPGGSYPLHKAKYYIKYKDKTYMLTVMYTTTSYKNKGIRSAVDKMLKSIKAKKKKKKKR